eukprot:11797705-Alexandrium_andersonii.AAC.1
MHCHDILHLHHDKDFRCLAVFQLPALQDVTLRVWRVNHWGQLEIDTILPVDESTREGHALIHRGHMRVLQAPEAGAAEE